MEHRSVQVCSFIDKATNKVERTNVWLQSGLVGYNIRLTDAARDHAWSCDYTHWIQPNRLDPSGEKWLVFQVVSTALLNTGYRYLGKWPNQDAAEMWVIHNAP